MNIATAEALIQGDDTTNSGVELYKRIAQKYVECMDDMDERAPGLTCMAGIEIVEKGGWDSVPFNPRALGCGAAMRSMCIGLRYHKPEQLHDLVEVSIESGRITHHCPIGYLGSLASAAFTSYAIQGVHINLWGWKLMNEAIPYAKEYIAKGRYAEQNLEAFPSFCDRWDQYLLLRGIKNPNADTVKPIFPEPWDVNAREYFYKSISLNGVGGAKGHDAPMIAYDALLWSGNDWEKFCMSGIIHSGDNDSTGAIGGSIFGAMFGFAGVPKPHYENLEYIDRMTNLGTTLYEMFYETK